MFKRLGERNSFAWCDAEYQYEMNALVLLHQHRFKVVICTWLSLLFCLPPNGYIILFVGTPYVYECVHDGSTLLSFVHKGDFRSNDNPVFCLLDNGKRRHLLCLRYDAFCTKLRKQKPFSNPCRHGSKQQTMRPPYKLSIQYLRLPSGFCYLPRDDFSRSSSFSISDMSAQFSPM